MPSDLIFQVEAWAKANGASRSEALRRLVELGLSKKIEPEVRVLSTSKEAVALAKVLGGKTSDRTNRSKKG
jgi:hypothetical protein